MMLARPAPAGHREEELHVGRVDLLTTRDADRPGEAAGRQSLAERRTEAVSGIGEYTAEADTGSDEAVDLGERDLRFRSSDAMLDKRRPAPIAADRSSSSPAGTSATPA
jgi:hypothetical protein